MNCVRTILITVSVLLASGCGLFKSPGQFGYQLPDPGDLADCFQQRGGVCPAPLAPVAVSGVDINERLERLASQAEDLANATQVELDREARTSPGMVHVASARAASDVRVASAASAIASSVRMVQRVSAQGRNETIRIKDLDAANRNVLSAIALDSFGEIASSPDTASLAVAPLDQWIAAYLRAYFRNGKFAEAIFDTSELRSQLHEELTEQLSPVSSPQQIDALTDKIIGRIVPSDVGRIEDASFVARGGKAYQFGGITLTVTPKGERPLSLTKVNGPEVVADLTRVVFEAVFDYIHGLPAVPNATGVTSGLGLEEHDACGAGNSACSSSSPMLSEAEFDRVEEISSQIDGATLALVGSSLRGVSWFSLNNEYLGTFLETVVAVTARKNAEKVVWCSYTCRRDGPVPASVLGGRVRMVPVTRSLAQ